MKKTMILLVLLIVIGASSAAWYPQKVNVPVTNYDNITLVDDKYMFFGTGADAAISYDSSEDKLYINNTPVYLEETVSLGTNISAPDLTVDGSARIDETLTVNGAARIDEASTIASLTINTTLDTNGDATFENVSLTQNKKLIFNTAGTGYIQWLTSGNYMTIKGNPQFDDGYTWSGTASPSSASDLVAIGGASDIDYSLSSGIFTTPTGANTLSGDTTISGAKTFTTGTGSVTIKGSTSIDAGKTFTVGETEHRTNTSATNITITDTDPDFWFCGNSTEPGNQTYVLPTAADNTGRIITFIVTTDPGANYVRVDGEGAETVDGTAIQATTDAVGTLLSVICDGAAWYELNSIGTWGGHA